MFDVFFIRVIVVLQGSAPHTAKEPWLRVPGALARTRLVGFRQHVWRLWFWLRQVRWLGKQVMGACSMKARTICHLPGLLLPAYDSRRSGEGLEHTYRPLDPASQPTGSFRPMNEPVPDSPCIRLRFRRRTSREWLRSVEHRPSTVRAGRDLQGMEHQTQSRR